MFERYIVCNRCGKRKSIQLDKRGDGDDRYCHLCDNCTNEFEKFMRIGENE